VGKAAHPHFAGLAEAAHVCMETQTR
jgi:hypothetical protein